MSQGMLPAVLGALTNKTATGGGNGNPGQDFSQQAAQLQGADPTMVNRQLDQINQLLGVLFVKTFQTLPNVANQISATMKTLSRAIKEAQQAANVTEVVSAPKSDAQPNPPISNVAAQQGIPDMGPPPPQPGM